jgi:hypothetical protein
MINQCEEIMREIDINEKELKRMNKKVSVYSLRADVHQNPNELTKFKYAKYLALRDFLQNKKEDLILKLRGESL